MKKLSLILLFLPWFAFASDPLRLPPKDTIPVFRDTSYQEMTITHYIETWEPVTESWDRFYYSEWKRKKLIVRIEKLVI